MFTDSTIHIVVVTRCTQTFNEVSELLAQYSSKKFNITPLEDVAELKLLSQHQTVDVVLICLESLVYNDIKKFSKIHSNVSQLPLVVLSKESNDELDSRLIKAGIQDIIHQEDVTARRFGNMVTYATIRHKRGMVDSHHFMRSHDPITQLPNQRLLQNTMNHTLENAKRYDRHFAVVVLGLDDFKAINDSLGYKQGDILLSYVANRLRKSIRSSDVLARIAGDEFVVLASNLTDDNNLGIIVQNLMNCFKQPFTLHNQEVYVSTSVGASNYPIDGTTTQALLKYAYAALNAAKSMGKNNFAMYDVRYHTRSENYLLLANALYKAIELDQFSLDFQPQYDVTRTNIVGVEALLRWHHRELGSIPPNTFIPIAEQRGLIVPISEWVLRHACLQMVAWQQQGIRDVKLGVNISAKHFEQNDFITKLQNILQETMLSPESLTIELTEGSIMRNPEKAIHTLTQLKKLGVKISIDDFGTGYSSLSYLKRFPLDVLKIDKSFVQDLFVDDNASHLVQTIIAMAQKLEFDVIAEGVETEEQKQFLLDNDCQIMQGFLLSKPVSAEICETLLAKTATTLSTVKLDK